MTEQEKQDLKNWLLLFTQTVADSVNAGNGHPEEVKVLPDIARILLEYF
jgi:hypothetical protein